MGRRMSRRRYIVHAACDFSALLNEPGSVGDRRQVLSRRGNRGLLERVGHRRIVDLAFVTAAGPVVPLRQRRCRYSNSQPGAGTKYTATGQDLRWEIGEPFGRVELIHVL